MTFSLGKEFVDPLKGNLGKFTEASTRVIEAKLARETMAKPMAISRDKRGKPFTDLTPCRVRCRRIPTKLILPKHRPGILCEMPTLDLQAPGFGGSDLQALDLHGGAVCDLSLTDCRDPKSKCERTAP